MKMPKKPVQILIRLFLFFPFVPFILLGLPSSIAILLGWVIRTWQIGAGWSAGLWIANSLWLYLIWLGLFILASAIEVRFYSLFRIRSSQAITFRLKQPRTLLTGIYLLTKYGREALFSGLPLISILRNIPAVQRFIFRGYAASVHLGWVSLVWGRLYDPDLTEIDDYAIVGGRSTISAHNFTIEPDGRLVYVSAPVRIGKHAVIGGESRVGMGVEIGDYAVVEPGSNVPAFTTIPPGEVWGGSPAVFLRYRASSQHLVEQTGTKKQKRECFPPPVPQTRSAPPPLPVADEPEEAELARLVVRALGLTEQPPLDHLNADSLASWDSLGQLAIAAALRSEYHISLLPEQVFQLRGLQDIRRLFQVSAEALPRPDTDPETEEWTTAAAGNPELLPLLPAATATRLLSRYNSELEFGNAQAPLQTVPLAVAATFTVEPLAPDLRLWARAFGLQAEIQFAEYNQVQRELIDPESLFAKMPEQAFLLLLVRLEDLGLPDLQRATEQIDQLLAALRAFAARRGGHYRILASTLPPISPTACSAPLLPFDELRWRWQRETAAIPQVEVLDFAACVQRVGLDTAFDPAFNAIARAPYSPAVYREVAMAVVRAMRRRVRPAAKVLALDCDNTLWGGLAAEDGVDALQLGADGPGRAFFLFQEQILQLKQRGILLVLVSRNQEKDVWTVFEQHPEMRLCRKDIAAFRINWQAKSANLRELATELNLGLDAFVFLDDDPAQRFEVRTHAPAVTVVPLPRDPARYVELLPRLWIFDEAATTHEDACRTEMMRAEQQRRTVGESCDMATYLQQLELRVRIAPPSPRELPRMAQLCRKTNQFNLSLIRYTREELAALPNSTIRLAVHAEDRFGEYGLIGVCLLFPEKSAPGVWRLDTFLLSCRALGRGIEQALLHVAARTAREQGGKTFLAHPVEGPRNAPVRAFLDKAGFQPTDSGGLQLVLDPLPPYPEHLQLD